VSEGLPFTTIEAMMCGRVTVNTDVGGVSEAVGSDGRLGGLVPPRDPDAFAQECLRFLTDDALREETGRRAREHALQSFALDSCIDAFRQWYEIAVDLRVAPATSDDLAYVAGMAS
jgi:glycosyltransferase involved in cell wall biosynthesis